MNDTVAGSAGRRIVEHTTEAPILRRLRISPASLLKSDALHPPRPDPTSARANRWQNDSLSSPTVFAVEVDLHSPLLRAQQGLRHLGDGQPLGVGPVHEVARARLLHDLGARVAAHVAEAVVAEDDGAVLHPGVGDDELAACGRETGESG